jgi:hypothetical protein
MHAQQAQRDEQGERGLATVGAKLSASRPKMGIPAIGPMCPARSSLVASGRPNSRFNMFTDKAKSDFVRQPGSWGSETAVEGVASWERNQHP